MSAASSHRVVVVGSVNVDLVARVDHLPAAGETVGDASFDRHPGGKGGNQAVAAARLGARVAFVGAVGDDPLANDARAALAGEGVDLSGLSVVAGPTGVALILVDRSGENVIAVAPGSNAGLTAELATGALGRPHHDDEPHGGVDPRTHRPRTDLVRQGVAPEEQRL